jgi:hypothetical protein
MSLWKLAAEFDEPIVVINGGIVMTLANWERVSRPWWKRLASSLCARARAARGK